MDTIIKKQANLACFFVFLFKRLGYENRFYQKGRLQDSSKWFYRNHSGALQTGWQLINSKWSSFYIGGQMAKTTTIDGYKLGKDGVWI
jgi:glucan-binding YG repeat protein